MKEKGAIKEIKPDKSFGKPVKADMPKDLVKFAGYYSALSSQWKVTIKNGNFFYQERLPRNKNLFTPQMELLLMRKAAQRLILLRKVTDGLICG